MKIFYKNDENLVAARIVQAYTVKEGVVVVLEKDQGKLYFRTRNEGHSESIISKLYFEDKFDFRNLNMVTIEE